MSIAGERSIEIDAPLARCFDIAADLERATTWQAALRDVDVHERDSHGRPVAATMTMDAKVRTISTQSRYTYDAPAAISWVQERGDVKSMRGSWAFADLGDDRTRATYALEVDPGRMLGLLVRGPGVVDKIRDYLIGGAVDGLRRRAESA
ncbi:MAG: SRPBCC family protein [Solirubrobacteraceae bacterium]|nr:SRPBCC family protein [Solirubrobacteraceae bacterium]